MKKQVKRSLSFLMVLTILISIFSGMNVSAFDLNQSYEVSWDYTLTDDNDNPFKFYVGLRASDNPYGYAMPEVERTIHDYTVKRRGLTGNKAGWIYSEDYVYAFCIEPGISLPNYMEYKGSDDPTHGNKWEAMSENQRKLIQLILAYGYPNRNGLTTSKDANACYAATQLLVWSAAMQWLTSPTAPVNDKTYPIWGHSGTMTEQLTSNPYLKYWYDSILADVANHYKIPSFANSISSQAQTYELTPSGGQYKLTMTDTNGVLSNYYVHNSAGMSVNITGNTLTVTSATPITNEKSISLRRRMPTTSMTTGFLIWSVPGAESSNQDMVSGVNNDPVPAYFNIKVSTGHMKIVKTSEDGVVANIPFTVKGTNYNQTVRTTSSGELLLENLVVGTYTVTEESIDRYEPQQTRTVTVAPGGTATVTFSNVLKRGDLRVTKTSEDGLNSGHTFKLTGTSLSGHKVEQYAVTNGSGIAIFEDVLISGTTPYVLEEVDTAIRYVVPNSQNTTIAWNTVTNRSVENILKKFHVEAKKSDSLTDQLVLTVGLTPYVLEEVNTAIRYVVPNNQNTTISWNTVTNKSVENILKKFRVEAKKSDSLSSDGSALGDATLAGAVYGLYKNGTLVKEYTTLQDGGFTTDYYVCGSDSDRWTLQEISPSTGYLLDTSDKCRMYLLHVC